MANYKQKLEEMATTPVIDETQFAEIIFGTDKQIEFGKERRLKVIEELNRYREAFPEDEMLKDVYEAIKTVNYATFFIDAWKHLNKEGIVDWIINNVKTLEKYRIVPCSL